MNGKICYPPRSDLSLLERMKSIMYADCTFHLFVGSGGDVLILIILQNIAQTLYVLPMEELVWLLFVLRKIGELLSFHTIMIMNIMIPVIIMLS